MLAPFCRHSADARLVRFSKENDGFPRIFGAARLPPSHQRPKAGIIPLFLKMDESYSDESVFEAELAMELVEVVTEMETGVVVAAEASPPDPGPRIHPLFASRTSKRPQPHVLTQEEVRAQAGPALRLPTAPSLLLSPKATPRQAPVEKRKRTDDLSQLGPPAPKKTKSSSSPATISPSALINFPTILSLSTLVLQFLPLGYHKSNLCIIGELFCTACHEPVSTKKSTIKNHVVSEKHLAGVESLARSQESQALMTKYIEVHHHYHSLARILPDFAVDMPKRRGASRRQQPRRQGRRLSRGNHLLLHEGRNCHRKGRQTSGTVGKGPIRFNVGLSHATLHPHCGVLLSFASFLRARGRAVCSRPFRRHQPCW